MNEYVKNSIINYAWHQFLYGYNSDDRKDFLINMVNTYPIKLDSKEPLALYMNDFMLPRIEQIAKPEAYMVKAVAREYFSFTLVSKIIDDTIRHIGIDVLNDRMNSFINTINRLFVTSDNMKISDIQSLRDILVKSKDFYKEQYYQLMENGEMIGDIDSLSIPFMEVKMFIRYYKKAIGTNSHLALILDYQGSGAIVSHQAVNSLITSRIAGDLAVKVACDPEEWITYYDFNDQMAESVHDYSIVELDTSCYDYVMKMKKKVDYK